MVKRRQRRVFTAAESAEVWDRWQRGEGLQAIGRVFGKTSSAIFAHLKPHGGIRPAPRRRSRRVLGMEEREEISRGIAAGVSLGLWREGLGERRRRSAASSGAMAASDGIAPRPRTSGRGTGRCDPSCASSHGVRSCGSWSLPGCMTTGRLSRLPAG